MKSKLRHRKEKLFNKLKRKNIFWSYKKDIKQEEVGDNILIEHTLKYGDFWDIAEIFRTFNNAEIKKVWEKTMKWDKRFIKTNLLIARVFFDMDVETDYFKDLENERFKKLKLLAAKDQRNFKETNKL